MEKETRHPGEVLWEEFLSPRGITPYRLSKEIGIQQTRIGEIIKGNRGITADTAIRLSRFFGTSEQFWMALQAEYELMAVQARNKAEYDKIQTFEPTDDKLKKTKVLSNFFRINLPYGIEKNKEGHWAAFNRDYKRLGENDGDKYFVYTYTDYGRLSDEFLTKLAGETGTVHRNKDTEQIEVVHFYRDATNPCITKKPEHWKQYFDKLKKIGIKEWNDNKLNQSEVLSNFFRINLPYGIKRNKEGQWAAFNSGCKRLGENDIHRHFDYTYTDYGRLSDKFLTELAGETGNVHRNKDTEQIGAVHFYKDATNPCITKNPEHWKQYFDKLKKIGIKKRKNMVQY